MTGRRLFDRYVVVDWSAAASPTSGSDSIWVAMRAAGVTPAALSNPATRVDAWRVIDAAVDEACDRDERVLVGVDASFGYPAGTASMFGLGGTPWQAMWRAVADRLTDDGRNRNNRFEVAAELNDLIVGTPGPFWGCAHDRLAPALERTKPSFGGLVGFAEFRQAEQRLRDVGAFPKSAWQLFGAGSVGGQTLTLLPGLWSRLDRWSVWPFTTGLDVPGGDHQVVVAEVWPTRFAPSPTAPQRSAVASTHAVRDARQVSDTAAALDAADASGRLAAWFRPAVRARSTIVDEEGWILGVE